MHTSTLAALYGGLQAAAAMLGPAKRHSGLDAAATLIKAFVLENGVRRGHPQQVREQSGRGRQPTQCRHPLRVVLPDSPLMRSTVERIEAELRRDGGGVHGYAEDSYYGGGEWVLLTAYLGWYYAEAGETEQAEALLERVAECANLRRRAA